MDRILEALGVWVAEVEFGASVDAPLPAGAREVVDDLRSAIEA